MKKWIIRLKEWKEKHRKWYRLILWGLILLVGFFVCDPRMKVVDYVVESEEIAEPITIVLVTDLHSCRYGKDQKTLIQAVAQQEPDVVLLCGDIFDDNLAHEKALTFVTAMAAEYPTYYVSGNHEYWSEEMDEIKEMVRETGATVLEGQCDTLEVNGQKIFICGVDDPTEIGQSAMLEQLAEAAEMREDCFSILMAHRPELIEEYLPYAFDLVVSGHAHGGQWRIPGVLNGLYAPDQGFFPKYAGGRYDYEETVHIVSRGLSRENLPIPRIFNRPELVVIEVR